jgi:ABC-2 type transport system ATP-binding protein
MWFSGKICWAAQEKENEGKCMNQLIVEGVNKTIKGNQVLKDVSLTAQGGRVYGIIGRNGSGKTMLFRAISGLMQIDSGTIRLGEQVLHRDFNVLPEMGLILENCGLYGELTGRENLLYLASFKKVIGQTEVDETLRRVGLDPDDKRTYSKYSLGMKQRLAIAQAIMEKPKVILLDEPTNGLDTDGVERIRTAILEEKERGAILFLASHNSEDIHMLSDEIYRIEKGVLTKEKKDETL